MESHSNRIFSNERVQLSWRIWFCFGVGHVLNDICASMWFTYLLIFFHFVLNFDTVSSGAILLIGQIADAVSTPFIGIESDRDIDSCLFRFGKRKTWHLVGTFCILSSFPFIFSPCVGCANAHIKAQMVYYSAFVIIFQFGWASVQISHLALIPELTPNEHQRTQLTAIRYCFSVISTVLVYVITWVSLAFGKNADVSNQIGPNDVFNFQRVVYIGLLIGICATCLFHWGVNEVSANEKDKKERNHKSNIQFMKDIKFYQLAGIYMSSRLFVNLVQINIPLYLHETLLKDSENLAIIPLIMYLGSVTASCFVNFLNKSLGRKVSYIIGSLIGIMACIWIKFGHHSDYETYLTAILFGISSSILIVTSLGLTADFIGLDTNTGAFVYGSMSFVDKLSNGIAVMAIEYMRNLSQSNNYYQNVLAYICGGAALTGMLLFLTLKSRIFLNFSNDSEETKSLL